MLQLWILAVKELKLFVKSINFHVNTILTLPSFSVVTVKFIGVEKIVRDRSRDGAAWTDMLYSLNGFSPSRYTRSFSLPVLLCETEN